MKNMIFSDVDIDSFKDSLDIYLKKKIRQEILVDLRVRLTSFSSQLCVGEETILLLSKL